MECGGFFTTIVVTSQFYFIILWILLNRLSYEKNELIGILNLIGKIIHEQERLRNGKNP
jgi:hypothetical protein